MAARTITSWVPITTDSSVVGMVAQPSAIDQASLYRKTMTTSRHDVPRFLGADVSGGSALTEDTNDGSVASLYDYLYNGKATFDEANAEDAPADEMEAFMRTWLRKANIAYDNASIGVTGDRSATASAKKPYQSLYYRVRNADASAGYVGDTNYTSNATLTYDTLSAALGLVEGTQFWDPETGCVLIHPRLMDNIRGIKGTSDGRPIFVESSTGQSGGGVRPQYNLFGLPAFFTHGAVTSTDFGNGLAGGFHPLVAFVNRSYLVYGKRIEPEARVIPARLNINALEDTIQARARRGFVLTVPQAAAVLEVLATT